MSSARSIRAPTSVRHFSPTPAGRARAGRLTVKLWQARIADVVRSHTFKPDIDSLVLDGIPRNVGQAHIMENIIQVKKVFHLSCPDRTALIGRLKKRR
jgi:adenylate kinase